MIRASILALSLGMASAENPYEWKGIFYTKESKYMWGAQKVNGDYGAGDTFMNMAVIPTSAHTADALEKATAAGTAAMGMECEEVLSGGVIKPAEGKCFKLVFDQASSQSLYEIDTSESSHTAFFCQHMPTEFEDTDHYFKDMSGVDIEPQAQEPEPGEGSHSHGHGGDSGGDNSGMCVCAGHQRGWTLDCTNTAKITDAINALDADAACKAKDPSESCQSNYYYMQAHHDHCLHDQLPERIEKDLHDYEGFYDDCFIKRQYDSDLEACPAVECSNQKALTEAVATLQAGCDTVAKCAVKACADAVKVVLMSHDTCAESDLPNNLETALHDHEDPCAAVLCNSADAPFDPYSDYPSCKAEVSAASGFGSHAAFLVTISALLLALISS